jgi:hypothetical protein
MRFCLEIWTSHDRRDGADSLRWAGLPNAFITQIEKAKKKNRN